jgi:hypothetical protein
MSAECSAASAVACFDWYRTQGGHRDGQGGDGGKFEGAFHGWFPVLIGIRCVGSGWLIWGESIVSDDCQLTSQAKAATNCYSFSGKNRKRG